MMTHSEIPKTGTAGHTTRFGTTTATALEKIKLQSIRGCPVNRNIPARMSRSCFRKACLRFQELAGIVSRENTAKKNNKYARITTSGFASNNKRVCLNCKIGKAVRNNKPFGAPPKLEFVNLVPVEQKVNKYTPKIQATKKLNTKDVLKIREMHQDGFSIVSIQMKFSKVSVTTISNVVNRVTWKNI
jgi:hypothetical protein